MRGSDRWGYLLAAIALLPYLVRSGLTAVWLFSAPPTLNVPGDDAVIELYVQHAAAGTQLLGPYSRFRWHHPGPTYFYVLAPLYEAAGRHAGAIHLGALLISTASAVGLLALARRVGGRPLLMWAAALVAVHGAAYSGLVGHGLNPFVTIMPTMLAVLAAGAVAAGWLGLPLFVAVGSFAVQTHLSSALVLGSVGLLALVWWSFQRDSRPAMLRWLGLTVLVGLVLWSLPLYEQLVGPEHNLGKLIGFFAAPHAPHSLGEAARTLATHLAVEPLFVLGGFRGVVESRPILEGAVAMGQVGLLLAAVTHSFRRGKLFLALGATVLVAEGAALWSVRSVVDELHWYLVVWLAGLAALGWAIGLAWLHSLAPGGGGLDRIGRIAALALVVGGSYVHLADFARVGLPTPWPASDALERIAVRAEGEAGGRPVLVRIGSPDAWPLAAGLAVRLQRAGVAVSVDEAWLWTFGAQHRPRGDEAVELLVVEPGQPGQGGLLGQSADGDLYLRRIR